MTEPNGIYYMRARFYDPQLGRFISEDPLGFGGSGVNLYIYAGHNPILFIDPLGLCDSWIFFDLSIDSFLHDSPERAATREAIELGDIAAQGQLGVTLGFDVGGFLATQTDIYYADVPFSNKLKATAFNAYGLLGIIGVIPSPKTAALGMAIDTHETNLINSQINPNSLMNLNSRNQERIY